MLRRRAATSGTGDYVAVRERFDQNEEPGSRNEDRTKKKPSLFTIVGCIDALTLQTCTHAFSNILCILFC